MSKRSFTEYLAEGITDYVDGEGVVDIQSEAEVLLDDFVANNPGLELNKDELDIFKEAFEAVVEACSAEAIEIRKQYDADAREFEEERLNAMKGEY